MDLEIRRLKARLIACLNEAQIPIEVKRYVVSDILKAVELKADELVRQEEEEELARQQETNKEEETKE